MSTTLEQAIEHGLSEEEFERIEDILGRRPNFTELGVFSVMWSEHCSYKSSRIHLATLPTEGPQVVQGPGENAGAVDIGDGWAAVFKMESHNHPSFIEPFQGAATGVGGILRDVFTMGARPIANLNSLRFGAKDHPKTKHLVNGVVGGIAHYGNCMGVPTVGGEVYFDPSYNGNILVNAFTLGVVKSEKIFKGVAEGVGNPVFYVGSGTGRDGIHGATMASDTFEEGDDEKRPTVQVGDPFREKLLLEACLELMATGAIIGIQDMGAAGLTSSSVEMADRAGTGLKLNIDDVPKRETGMTAYEALLSESQERMLMVVDPKQQDQVGRIFDKWELEWAQIGEVTDTGRFEIFQHNEQVCDIPIDALASQAPKYDRPATRPKYLDELEAVEAKPVDDLSEFLVSFIASPNLASRRGIYEQYDHMVGTATVIRPGEGDAAVLRTPAHGIAIAVDCSSRKCFINPREGAKHAVAECTRNLACVGARAIGTTDCLNFGDPTNPEIMWQFKEAIAGLGEACRALDAPIVGGNVSLYNASDGTDIFPTPTVACVGTFDAPIESRSQTVSMTCTEPGRIFAVVGAKTNPEDLGGSEFLWVQNRAYGEDIPRLDLDLELRTQSVVRRLISDSLIDSAHDCAEGGLGVALLEKLFGTRCGFELTVDVTDRPGHFLFSETPSRIVVSFNEGKEGDIRASIGDDVEMNVIGRTNETGRLTWGNLLDVAVSEAEQAWEEGLSDLT